MSVPETLLAIRYGFGTRPNEARITDPNVMLRQLRQTDPAERRFPIASLKSRAALLETRRKARSDKKDGKSGAETAEKRAAARLRQQGLADIRATFQRAMTSKSGFRERLVAFWADHFSVAANGPVLSALVPDAIERAVRGNIAGRFPDMLQAVTFHPAMLIYLNQVQSVGPNSRAGKRRDRGLNENLAREIFELHTLGVGGGYTQTDVRQFAELLTGLSADKSGFKFRPGIVEPGTKTVLGKSYGAKSPSLDPIRAALGDIALHPDTARHLSRKLITHFVGIAPPDDWVETMARAYLQSGGDLMALYGALLGDKKALSLPLNKVKLPFEFMVSALRAADIPATALDDISVRDVRSKLLEPLTAMGQPLFRPNGPDGWAEAPEAWITPATLAARLRWVGGLVDEVLQDTDPRKFLDATLGDVASEFLTFAVAGSESRPEGAALVLVSPEFNRR